MEYFIGELLPSPKYDFIFKIFLKYKKKCIGWVKGTLSKC